VISGPSGVGKGTVVRRLLARHPELSLSISATTRRPRPTELDGVDYFFVSAEGFDELLGGDELLEWAEVFGARYGTPLGPVEVARNDGRDVILEIDVQGSRQVKDRIRDAILVFLEPPSLEELERRLRARATEDDARITLRLATAAREMEQRSWFDHVVVNDDLERATEQLEAIIQGSPHPTEGRAHP
jgi:guanylate kinase